VGISLVAVATSLLVLSVSATVGRGSSALLGKWMLISAAILSAVPLVVSANGR